MRIVSLRLVVGVFAALLALVVCLSCTEKQPELGSQKNPIKFYFVPSVDSTLQESGSRTIKDYLEKTTPYHYRFSIPQNYMAVVDAFGEGKVDVAAMNIVGYILVNKKYGAEALLRWVRYGSDTYKSQIIAKADGPVKKLEDINGKRFAYVDATSVSGYLMPAKFLQEKNIKPGDTAFVNQHDSVITLINEGKVDAGATFYNPPEDGKIQDARRLVIGKIPDVEQKIKIIALTSEIPNDPIVFRKDLPGQMKKTIQDALVQFVRIPEGQKTMHDLFGASDFRETTDKDYDSVRDMIKTLQLGPQK